MEQKHDRSYHRLFSEPALVEDLIRNFVNEDWVSQLDFKKMQRINAKFHSDALERRDGDIILSIPFLDDESREIYLFLLLLLSVVFPPNLWPLCWFLWNTEFHNLLQP